VETPARASFFRHAMNSYSKIPKYLKKIFLVSFLLTTSMLLITLIFFFRIQPQVPLFYSLARQSQHLTSKNWLFLLPALSLAISLTHLLIIKLIGQSDQLLMKLFAWTTVGVQFMFGLALFRILIIIT